MHVSMHGHTWGSYLTSTCASYNSQYNLIRATLCKMNRISKHIAINPVFNQCIITMIYYSKILILPTCFLIFAFQYFSSNQYHPCWLAANAIPSQQIVMRTIVQILCCYRLVQHQLTVIDLSLCVYSSQTGVGGVCSIARNSIAIVL